MNTYLILGCYAYNFVNKDTGEVIKGNTMHIVDPFDVDDGNRKGCVPLKLTISDKVRENIGELPGLYDIDFGQRPGAGGKPTSYVRNLSFVAPVDLLAALDNAKDKDKAKKLGVI
ncbi:MAG: hypothetical protein LBT22_08425 [Peptococcaceae bacterium]|jgi:hypothetical protein|nr:hypothetical protein [Peptococcaceae bacterium]